MASKSSSSPSRGRIKINFARERDFRILFGVGAKVAKNIVKARTRGGNITEDNVASIPRLKVMKSLLDQLDFEPNPDLIPSLDYDSHDSDNDSPECISPVAPTTKDPEMEKLLLSVGYLVDEKNSNTTGHDLSTYELPAKFDLPEEEFPEFKQYSQVKAGKIQKEVPFLAPSDLVSAKSTTVPEFPLSQAKHTVATKTDLATKPDLLKPKTFAADAPQKQFSHSTGTVPFLAKQEKNVWQQQPLSSSGPHSFAIPSSSQQHFGQPGMSNMASGGYPMQPGMPLQENPQPGMLPQPGMMQQGMPQQGMLQSGMPQPGFPYNCMPGYMPGFVPQQYPWPCQFNSYMPMPQPQMFQQSAMQTYPVSQQMMQQYPQSQKMVQPNQTMQPKSMTSPTQSVNLQSPFAPQDDIAIASQPEPMTQQWNSNNVVSGSRPQTPARQQGQTQSQARGSVSLPKALHFDGKVMNSWTGFRLKFLTYADEKNWTQAEMKDRLCWCLDGKASEYFATLVERHAGIRFNEILQRMEKRFGKFELPDTAQEQLVLSRQRSNESIDEWADRVLQLAVRAYPNLPEQFMESQAIKRICHGCLDREAGQHVINLNLKSVELVVDTIKRFQFNHQSIYDKGRREVKEVKVAAKSELELSDDDNLFDVRRNRRFQPPRKDNTIDKSSEPAKHSTSSVMERRMSQLDEKVSRLQADLSKVLDGLKAAKIGPPGSPGNRSRSPSPSGRCFACGGLGHMAQDCPTRKQENRPAKHVSFSDLNESGSSQ